MLETRIVNAPSGPNQGPLVGGPGMLEAPARSDKKLDLLTFSDDPEDALREDESPPNQRGRGGLADRFAENPLIISTSAYLTVAIQRHLQAHAGAIEIGKLAGGIREELRYSLIVPSSNFASPDSMLAEYSAFMKPLGRGEQIQLARTFLEGVTEARADGRYFGRHKSDLHSYRTKYEIVEAFMQFLHGHGYRLREPKRFLDENAHVKPAAAEELFKLLISARDPRPCLRHESHGSEEKE